jgi:hypothetical protein
MTFECAFNLGNAIVTLSGVALGGIIGFLSARYISDRNAIAVAIAHYGRLLLHHLINLIWEG